MNTAATPTRTAIGSNRWFADLFFMHTARLTLSSSGFRRMIFHDLTLAERDRLLAEVAHSDDKTRWYPREHHLFEVYLSEEAANQFLNRFGPIIARVMAEKATPPPRISEP
jgi:hypothetical protein